MKKEGFDVEHLLEKNYDIQSLKLIFEYKREGFPPFPFG